MNPTIIFGEITSGVAGDTLIIPDVPPSEGFHTLAFNIPDIQIPPYPAINIDTLSFYTFYQPVLWGVDNSAPADVPQMNLHGSMDLSDGELDVGGAHFIVASGFSGTLTLTALLKFPNFSGNVYVRSVASAITMGASSSHVSGDSGYEVKAVLQNEYNYFDTASISIAGVLGGDLIRIEFARDATDPLDTLGANCLIYGWKIEYNV